MDLRKIYRELSTDDLSLRPSKLSDAEGLFAMLSDPQSMKYWSDQPVTDIEDAIEVLGEVSEIKELFIEFQKFLYDERVA